MLLEKDKKTKKTLNILYDMLQCIKACSISNYCFIANFLIMFFATCHNVCKKSLSK